jgi:hypothetical protein
MKTPITYYGGKQKLLPHILPLIPTQGQGPYSSHNVFMVNGATIPTGATGTLTSVNGLTPTTNGNYVIPPGQQENFVFQGTYPVTSAGQYKATLIGVLWSSIDATSYTSYPPTGYAVFMSNNTLLSTPWVTAQ